MSRFSASRQPVQSGESKSERIDRSMLPPDRGDPLLYSIPHVSVEPRSLIIVPKRHELNGKKHINISGCQLPCILSKGYEPVIPLYALRKTVFSNYDFDTIEKTIAELLIVYERANIEQTTAILDVDPNAACLDEGGDMEMLKRSDVERVLGSLRKESVPCIQDAVEVKQEDKLPIVSTVDDRTKGWLHPARKGGRCIQCRDCCMWFIVQDFVTHSHFIKTEKTVEWALDSGNFHLMMDLDDSVWGDPILRAKFDAFVGYCVNMCKTNDELVMRLRAASITAAPKAIKRPAYLIECPIVCKKPSVYQPLPSLPANPFSQFAASSQKGGKGLTLDFELRQKERKFQLQEMANMKTGLDYASKPGTSVQYLLEPSSLFPRGADLEPVEEYIPVREVENLYRDMAEFSRVIAAEDINTNKQLGSMLDRMKQILTTMQRGKGKLQNYLTAYPVQEYLLNLKVDPKTPMMYLEAKQKEQREIQASAIAAQQKAASLAMPPPPPPLKLTPAAPTPSINNPFIQSLTPGSQLLQGPQMVFPSLPLIQPGNMMQQNNLMSMMMSGMNGMLTSPEGKSMMNQPSLLQQLMQQQRQM